MTTTAKDRQELIAWIWLMGHAARDLLIGYMLSKYEHNPEANLWEALRESRAELTKSSGVQGKTK